MFNALSQLWQKLLASDYVKSFSSLDLKNMGLWTLAALLTFGGFGFGFLSGKGQTPSAISSQGVEGNLGQTGAPNSLFGQIRKASAERLSDLKPLHFAVFKQHIDTSSAEPSACVEFSKPLDPTKPYQDYVVVSPALPAIPAVTVKDSTLCISGIGFSDRRVTLLKGLPSKSDGTLSENKDLDFAFTDKPPYVGFAGNGVILPREDADGIAIETVNVSSLKVEVWHVSDRNMVQKTLSAPDPTAEGDYDDDWGDNSASDVGVKVYEGNITVKGAQSTRTTSVFPLESVLKTRKAGAFLIKAIDASSGRDKNPNDQPALARRWVVLTDMALTTYRGSDGIDTVVRSLKTAKPLSGVRLHLVAQNGETLSEARTDAAGRVRFAKALLKGTDALSPKMIMAYGASADFTMTDLTRSPMDLSAQAKGGRQDQTDASTGGRNAPSGVDGFIYTDRGIYRPGEKLRVVALVRDAQGLALKDRKGALVITRPSGVEAFRLTFTKTPDGFAAGDISLPSSAPRGQWKARLEIEGLDEAAGQTSFSVEDFAPQRLAVDITADKDKPLLGENDQRPIMVRAKFLYGASGSGLEVKTEARIRTDGLPFPNFKDFQFGDAKTPYQEKYLSLPDARTDGSGQAVVPFMASDAGQTQQPLSVLVTSSVMDPGGRMVRESETLRIRTRATYIGIKTEALDTKYNETPKTRAEIVAVDANGQAIRLTGVTLKLIAEHWDYDWYINDGRWQWRSTSRDALISTETISLDGAKPYSFQKALDWGDYRIEATHEASGTVAIMRFSSGWGQGKSGTDAPDQVRLSPVRNDYAQGDTIELKIQSPYKGEAQIAVATDRLIDLATQAVGDQGDTIRLKTDASWGGGAYVLLSVIQPRDAANAPKPRRALGLVYIPLKPKSRKLEVKMDVGSAPVVATRGDDGQAYVDIPVSVQGLGIGEKAKITLAVVDQGILNLTKFKTPDPAEFYFGKRALSLDLFDDYGRLLDPNLGAASEPKFGADQIGGEGLNVTPIRTTAIWSGVFKTGLDGKTRVRVPLKRFNGQVRLMAVVWTDKAVGASEQNLVVREPVVAELLLPRFLRPGDQAFATLELNNMSAPEGAFKAIVTGLKGLKAKFDQMFSLNRDQRQTASVAIEAPENAGLFALDFALSGNSVDIKDSYPIQSQLGWGTQSKSVFEHQKVNENYVPSSSLLSGYVPGTARIEVSYSALRGIDPGAIASSLSRYPYGCTEQVVSVAMPLLQSSRLSLVPLGANQSLKTAVDKLLDRLGEDGAIGLWRVGDRAADGFIGAYATDFLLDARAKGVIVPQDGIDRALKAMSALTRPQAYETGGYRLSVPEAWGYSQAGAEVRSKRLKSRAQAYALYVLAKAGKGDLSRLRWYHDVALRAEDSPLARAQIAAALSRMGDKARSNSAFKAAISTLGYDDREDWYQTPLRDLAGVLALAAEVDNEEVIKQLTPRLEKAMKSPDQLNTQEKSFILKAAALLTSRAGPVSIEVENAIADAGRYRVTDVTKARFKNKSAANLWRTVTVSGVPIAPPLASANGLRIERTYFTPEGTRITPDQVAQGTKLIVLISGVSDRAEHRPIIIDDALAAGFEIETTLSNEDTLKGPFGFIGALSVPDVQESRDDRYIASLTVRGGQRFAVAYVVRAVTPGSFYLPGTRAEDFYRPDISGQLNGARLTISAR